MAPYFLSKGTFGTDSFATSGSAASEFLSASTIHNGVWKGMFRDMPVFF